MSEESGHADAVAAQLREADAETLTEIGVAPESVARERLEAAIDAHEAVDWSAVETISVAEAATWTTRLIDALEQLDQEGE